MKSTLEEHAFSRVYKASLESIKSTLRLVALAREAPALKRLSWQLAPILESPRAIVQLPLDASLQQSSIAIKLAGSVLSYHQLVASHRS